MSVPFSLFDQLSVRFVICVLFWRGISPLLVASCHIYPSVSIFHFARTLPFALFRILTKHTIAATAARASEQGRTSGFSPLPPKGHIPFFLILCVFPRRPWRPEVPLPSGFLSIDHPVGVMPL